MDFILKMYILNQYEKSLKMFSIQNFLKLSLSTW